MRRTLLTALTFAALITACGGDKPAVITPATNTPAAASTVTAAATAASSPAATCAQAAKKSDASLFKLVDKQRSLPADLAPSDLVAIPDRLAVPGFAGQRMRKEPADALVKLLDAADAQGIQLRARSTYRSYSEQITTFQYWVNQLGEAQARRESAEPGHSEHQMGTVADVVSKSINWELITPFGDTTEGKWLVAHASEYGFAISYPKDGEATTGYIYEPWHIRYLGTTCSKAWADSGLVLVKFLEAVAAAS